MTSDFMTVPFDRSAQQVEARLARAFELPCANHLRFNADSKMASRDSNEVWHNL